MNGPKWARAQGPNELAQQGPNEWAQQGPNESPRTFYRILYRIFLYDLLLGDFGP